MDMSDSTTITAKRTEVLDATTRTAIIDLCILAHQE